MRCSSPPRSTARPGGAGRSGWCCLLRRTAALSLILSVVGSFLAFNQFWILTQGGPGTSTTTVVMWIFERGFVELHLGAATALSLALVVVVGLVSALQFVLLREKD